MAQHLTEANCKAWLARARGKSKREIEQWIASESPKADVPERLTPLPSQLAMPSYDKTTCPGPTPCASRGRTKPLSGERWSVQFTASAELHAKIEQAKELLSHAVPHGDLATLFERALDTLIEQQLKRKLGAGICRKRRPLKPGSRHVPLEVVRLVWERDGGQCTFVDTEGHRCSSRRFVTLEHRHPFSLGGSPSAENLCLLCRAHNLHTARQVFGEWPRKAAPKTRETDESTFTKLSAGLKNMGFSGPEVRRAIAELGSSASELGSSASERSLGALLKAALELLVPAAQQATT